LRPPRGRWTFVAREMRCIFTLALLALAPLVGAQVVTDVGPRVVPTGADAVITVSAFPSSTTSVPFTFALGAGSPVAITAVVVGSGPLQLTVPASSLPVGSPGALLLTGAGRTFMLQAYDVPAVASIAALLLSTAGLTKVTLSLAPASGPPTSHVRALVLCRPVSATAPAVTLTAALVTASPAFSYYPTDTTVSAVAGSPPVQTVTFTASSVPRTKCAVVDVYLAFSESALAVWHWSGASSAPAGLVVALKAPIKVSTLFPSSLAGGSYWEGSHNRARIAMQTLYRSAVDSSTYYERAWIDRPLPDGSDLATSIFEKTIADDGAELILCTGGEFKKSGNATAAKHPNVNIIVMSTLRNVLPAYDNLATATGRMYEAIFHAGFVSASVAKTGSLGLVLALDHPTSYAFLNAYTLGAQLAFAKGVVPPTATSVKVTAYYLDDFNLPWNEKTVGAKMLASMADGGDAVDVIMAVTDNAPSIEAQAIALGKFAVGFNNDDRLSLGDNVVISALYEWEPIYMEYVRRVLNNEKFGGTFFDQGLGFGVSLTSISPKVPLEAQAMSLRMQLISAEEDLLEEVFCGTLIGEDGTTVILDGVTGVVATAPCCAQATCPAAQLCLRPAQRGYKNRWCLATLDIQTMNFKLNGVVWQGLWVPPPIPVDPTWSMPSSLSSGMLVLPAATIILIIVSSVMVMVKSNEPVIRFSSPTFLLVCNAGALLYAVALILPAISSPSDTSCNTQNWLYGFGFSLLHGALFARIHRVARLFGNTSLRRLRLTSAYVVQLIVTVLLVEMVVLLVLAFVLPSVRTVTHVLGDSPYYFARCGAGGKWAAIVDGGVLLSALHFSLLMWGGYLAFYTRNLPEGFNESYWIGLSIYNVAVCELVGLVLSSSIDASPSTQYILDIIRMGVPPFASLLLLHGPKAYALVLAINVSEGDSGKTKPSESNAGRSGGGRVAPSPKPSGEQARGDIPLPEVMPRDAPRREQVVTDAGTYATDGAAHMTDGGHGNGSTLLLGGRGGGSFEVMTYGGETLASPSNAGGSLSSLSTPLSRETQPPGVRQ
jgi:basic membrane lipoprotein Med (substrate-binding protein (PBP1-ABC) superfamily)